MNEPAIDNNKTVVLLKTAFLLSIITIFYNLVEGLVSTFFGFQDETVALFGFGIDSFVEVISGIGIAHMVWRMKFNKFITRDKFEKQALYITGICFYLLTISLIAGSVLNFIYKNSPETTAVGIIVSVISILTMWILYSYKLKTGKELNSEPIIADANCTKTCFYLSFILLFSSLIYELFKIGYVDILGGLGIAVMAYREGKETLYKAKTNSISCDCCSD